MDREQEEMQFLGFFDIYKEASKIILSWRKIFTQITSTLILPLSFIFLIHMEISNLLFRKILINEIVMDETRRNTPQYNKLDRMISSELITLVLFKIAYFTLLLIFSLLSTSAVVYTIASIYTAKEVTFKRVMSVVPKVWKRLMLTFLCAFAAFFIYNIVTMLVMFLSIVTIGISSGGVVVLVLITVLYFIGFVYLTVVWQLASVVTVLEDSWGIRAMAKSKELIKGKMVLSIFVFFTLVASFVSIRVLFKVMVVDGWRVSSVDKTAYGVLCFLLLSCLFLFGLVLQTVLYFVCKSYHHENIDKSALADHLEGYRGEYVPLTAKDVQLEQYQV
ncbi:hypothetical protein AAZX31_13G024100 [Glycine max]|uniref:Uncharacterized protein n=2 Tax=Glycine subgen. Soja TaxID=1462606 RepID=C6T941_SOYBN|nr:uncharacterized protein LOC100819866 [Glycine max]XP_028197905.1 uncharacterized protein LOC114382580 [Glycine soja]XP_040862436.1 uncharacterized protein LOC121173010 [Glycine max]ACU18343.1 unknown [Glycine max]KAG4387300.1 hypothetical protein GLYMA_11G178501v4 [Glycine max]KAG4969483.1 hypothetical protein JHK85_035904 [Glycine max]KAG4975836.1 hypothetical protein JHK86_035310 [Glycine max]KAG5111914.1 hypothetical protein JHK82_035183 [Glycine max]|eukprot:NP_001241069.1 uncharacterized protein LOC100819866 [Glycine max]